jgi:hypothetical protein
MAIGFSSAAAIEIPRWRTPEFPGAAMEIPIPAISGRAGSEP